jgi:hypothetical protein
MTFRARNFTVSILIPILFRTMLCSAPEAKAGEAWHHLTQAQLQSIINTLAPTHLRPAAPAYIPPGFRVTLAEADASIRYANGDYDPGFKIEYRGPEGQCFGLIESKGGSRGLQNITTVNSAIGPIAIYRDVYATEERRNILTAFLPPGESVMLKSGFADEKPDGSVSFCKSIGLQEFVKVAKSIQWLKK